MARGAARGRPATSTWVAGLDRETTDRLARRANREQAQAALAAQTPHDALLKRMGDYRPRKVSVELYRSVQAGCVDLALRAVAYHGSSDREARDRAAYDYLKVVAQLAIWWVGTLGQPFDPMLMLDPDRIDAWASTLADDGRVGPSAASFRSTARRVAAAVGAPGSAPPVLFARAERLAPHTPAERWLHYETATRLAEPWRTDVLCMLDCSYGAGLPGNHIELIASDWVEPVDGGCVLHVPARRGRGADRPARHVPVVGLSGRRLARIAAERPGLLFRPDGARGGRAVEAACKVLRRRPGAGGFDNRRASSRWVVDQLDSGIPFAVVASIAGWAAGTDTPSEVLPHLRPVTPAECLAAVRQARP